MDYGGYHNRMWTRANSLVLLVLMFFVFFWSGVLQKRQDDKDILNRWALLHTVYWMQCSGHTFIQIAKSISAVHNWFQVLVQYLMEPFFTAEMWILTLMAVKAQVQLKTSVMAPLILGEPWVIQRAQHEDPGTTIAKYKLSHYSCYIMLKSQYWRVKKVSWMW